MLRNMKILSGVLMALLVSACLTVPSANAVSGQQTSDQFHSKVVQLGKPDLSDYCQSLEEDAYLVLIGPTAYDWRCVRVDGSNIHFTVTDACQWTFDDSDITDRMLDYYNPDSWSCFTNASKLGRPKLNLYCKRVLGSTVGIRLIGPTAYDWRCIGSGGEYLQFTVTQVCKWSYRRDTVDRVYDFWNPLSWECWG